MIHNIIWDISQPVECASWMQLYADAGSEVGEFANTLYSSGLVIIPGADTFSNDIPVSAAAN